MISSFLKTLRQANDPRILRAVGLATIFTLLSIFLAVIVGAVLMDGLLDFFSSTLQSWFGSGESWFRGFAQFLGGSLILVISYFFFAGIHGAFVGIFIDDILDAVHRKHYPQAPWQKPPPMMQSLIFSGRILVMTLVLNLIASPFLILGWFIPPLGLSLQIILNGYLLGKEYGQLVEFRIPKDQPASPVPKYFVNGMIASCIWVIPVLNLLAPILLAGSVLHTRVEFEGN